MILTTPKIKFMPKARRARTPPRRIPFMIALRRSSVIGYNPM
jgi:hypothetical protein